jgi:hypothetical protein
VLTSSRRFLWGETSSTYLSSPRRNARGWMRIIKRYGRKYPHCSRATQGLKRGCIASARHYNAEVGVRLYHTWPEWDSCLYLVSLLDLGSSVDTERRDHPRLSGRNMTASMGSRAVLMYDNEPLACKTRSSYSSSDVTSSTSMIPTVVSYFLIPAGHLYCVQRPIVQTSGASCRHEDALLW